MMDFQQREPVFLLGGAVKADAALGARAVVPEDHRRSLGGISGEPVFQKLEEAFFAAHGIPAPIRDGLKIPVPDFDQVAGVACYFIIVPGLRPARQKDEVQFFTGFRDGHFIDVLAGVALNVRPAHIDQQGHIRLRQRAGREEHKTKGEDDRCDFFHLISPNSAALFIASARVETPSF